MPPKKQQDLQIIIKSKDQLEELFSLKKLSVIDVHLTWCGPCGLLGSIYRSIAMKIDEWDSRLQFLVADVGVVHELASYQNSCKPKFLFFLGSKFLGEVSGVDVPKIQKMIARNIPSLDQD